MLETYHERFGIILPTVGSILDIGRTLYHTEEAVDAYLKSLDKLLLLRYHGLPLTVMLRLLECSRSLLDEYVQLAEQHLPDVNAMRDYLTARGIPLDDVG